MVTPSEASSADGTFSWNVVRYQEVPAGSLAAGSVVFCHELSG